MVAEEACGRMCLVGACVVGDMYGWGCAVAG